MIHAVIMRPDKFKTACEVRFVGTKLKGKRFKHLTKDELQSIDCEICKNKVIKLINNRSAMLQGGRSILLDF